MKKNKNLVLIIAIVLSIISVIGYFYFTPAYHYCVLRARCPITVGNFLFSAIPLLVFLYSIPFLLFSIWTYFLKEEIFKLWLKFSYIWASLSIIYVLIGRDMRGNFYNGLIHKQTVAISIAILYFVISLAIIISGVLKSRQIKK